MTASLFAADFSPVIVGHRGAALVVAENTMASFERAFADGATVVECDVHLSRDNTPIIMHDETIDRMAAEDSELRTGALADVSDAQLASVRLVDGHRVPHLRELLEMHELELYVEVKVASAAEESAKLINEVRADAGSRDTVISFVPEALAVVREFAPKVGLGLLVHRVDEATWGLMEELGCGWLSCDVEGLTMADAERARGRGLKINVWTVNNAEQLEKAVTLKPDSISTDDPKWAIELLNEMGVTVSA